MKTQIKILILTFTILFTTGCIDPSREQNLEAKVQEQAQVIEHIPALEKKALLRGFGLGTACTVCVALLVAFVFKGESKRPSMPPRHENQASRKSPALQSPEPPKPVRSAVPPASSSQPSGVAIPIFHKKPALPKRKINVDVSSLMGGGGSIGLMGVASLIIHCDRKAIPTRWICDTDFLSRCVEAFSNESAEQEEIISFLMKLFFLARGGFVQSQFALQDRVIISNNVGISEAVSNKRNVPVEKVEVHTLSIEGGRMFCRALGADPISILDQQAALRILKLLSPNTRPKSLQNTKGQNGNHNGAAVAPR